MANPLDLVMETVSKLVAGHAAIEALSADPEARKLSANALNEAMATIAPVPQFGPQFAANVTRVRASMAALVPPPVAPAPVAPTEPAVTAPEEPKP